EDPRRHPRPNSCSAQLDAAGAEVGLVRIVSRATRPLVLRTNRIGSARGSLGMARKTSNWSTIAAALALLALSFAAYGCGGNEERTSNLRPPTPINVSVTIGDNKITASPSKFGAGPIVLLARNPSHPAPT